MSRGASIPLLASMIFAVSVVTTVAEDFSIDWYTIDCGGETWSAGGDFELGGTIAQPDAGPLVGNGFAVSGGFWVGAAESGTIPTVSEWGLVVMSVLMLTAGTLVCARRQATRA